MQTRWDHNLHYHRLVLDAVPVGARTALDVGCGEGILARELRDRVPQVTGVDVDAPQLELARAAGGDVAYVLADVLTADLPQVDLVASVATLHHLDARAGLRRMAELVAPGGRLVVVGLARSDGAVDAPREAVAVLANAVAVRRRGYWEHSAPQVWPSPETYRGMRAIVRDVLPGATFRRHLYWRWSLEWDRPA
ncbi:bifunctional 2-polyprenyl-6-hydroxyphenol methylase/3-demethylubiquinol 3-O-methyltransferase UbiG [Cellulomonas sp. PhB150]|uniref:class I SAM-dependent methyltransferase n=1 Tax=Cellulomonas sp. PhB150 TaxID=2485188 RepID=UPI000F4A2163|nr:class I SAM-dependent methyltransferase [Cellulomonas sp. PhB150]ROS23782.1 methyltransferase family protein [Cellulomonas sp. PhB150]